MIIKTTSNVPDSTYFCTGDAEPEMRGDTLLILEGRGQRRGWGQPGVSSTVVVDDCDLVAIHVGFHHKHGGGQFWRYYMAGGDGVEQVTWAKLPDQFRQKVLAAYEEKAPGWAKVPGKLRGEYKKPASKSMTSYKLVRICGNQMESIYGGATYEIGKRLAEAVDPRAGEDEYGDVRHAGGYYSHPTPERVLALWESGSLVPARCISEGDRLAMVECEISGRIAKFPNGKLASTYIKPVAVVAEYTVGGGNVLVA